MSARYQNIVGSLAWIASRDVEASDHLNELWSSAQDQIGRIVAAIYLSEFIAGLDPPSIDLDKAKAELRSACRDEKLKAMGYTVSNEEIRGVPSASWLNVDIDEVEGVIGRARPMWLGVAFRTNDLRVLWTAPEPMNAVLPKKPTGPRPKLRKQIRAIMDIHRRQETNALARGEDPPPPPTSQQIAEALSSPGQRVSPRTVRDNMLKIRGNNDHDSQPAQ